MAFMIVAATCHTLVILVLASIILIRIPFAKGCQQSFTKYLKVLNSTRAAFHVIVKGQC